MLSFQAVRRALAIAWILLQPASALAQPAAIDAGTELDAVQGEVDRDYAEALSNDCATACRALESMRRAAERLCVLDPGDRCSQALQRVHDAVERVRAACPGCALASGSMASTPPAPPPSVETAQLESAPAKRGGCAGCATTPASGDALAPFATAAAALLFVRRRRRR